VRLLKGLVRVPDVAFFCWDKLPGRVLPSKEAAQALAGMSETAAGEGGLDAPDGPVTGSQTQSAPFDASNSAGRMNGTVSLAMNVTTEHSKVTVDLTEPWWRRRRPPRRRDDQRQRTTWSRRLLPRRNRRRAGQCGVRRSTFAGTTTIKFSINGDFTGTVDDNANLAVSRAKRSKWCHRDRERHV
jgi:hypothetical protein